MPERLLAIGVDGAPGGWLAAACFGTDPGVGPEVRRTELAFWASEAARSGLAALDAWRREQGDGAPLAVDIPIGLMELGGARPCDVEARKLLAGRAGSIFNPPGRYLLAALKPEQDSDYKAVAAAVSKRKGAAAAAEHVEGLGSTPAALLPKVREANEYVRGQGLVRGGGYAAETLLFEVHPELSFNRMRQHALADAGRVPEHLGAALSAKATPRGVIQRLALVRRQFNDAEDAAGALEWNRSHGLYDVLDAYAALWTALRWARGDFDLTVLTGDGFEVPPRDEDGAGLLMRMVV